MYHLILPAAILGLPLTCVGSLASDEQKLVTFGTSLTVKGGWQKEFQDSLGNCFLSRVKVIKKGMPGRSSKWALENINEVIDENPEFVILEFAINDARISEQINPEETFSLTASIVQAIRSSKQSTKIFLLITNPVLGVKQKTRPHLERYYESYRNAASKLGLGLIDTAKAWRSIPPEQIPDGVHPTRQAHAAITVPLAKKALSSYCDNPSFTTQP